MVLLIKYIDFHWDNYQGGSGKSFEFTISRSVPDNVLGVDLWSFVHDKVKEHARAAKPFNNENDTYIINKVTLV